jgi:tRNA threonylcarbamoyladenosine modification (KEOPS) complex Cgi121 subunit
MMYYMEEYGKYAEITAYKKNAFAAVQEFLKQYRKQTQSLQVQFFDAELIATREHLYFAIMNALQAFKGKTNISKSSAMETMLYASAQRQIQKAIERCGIKPQTTSIAVVVIGDNQMQIETFQQTFTKYIGVEPDGSVLKMTTPKVERIKQAFEITDEELKTVVRNGDKKRAIVDLVIERVALLSTQT